MDIRSDRQKGLSYVELGKKMDLEEKATVQFVRDNFMVGIKYNSLSDKLRVLAKYKMLIIDEIGYLPMDIQGANLFNNLYNIRNKDHNSHKI